MTSQHLHLQQVQVFCGVMQVQVSNHQPACHCEPRAFCGVKQSPAWQGWGLLRFARNDDLRRGSAGDKSPPQYMEALAG
ncbi:MAG: hypothetical protein AB1453_03980 [Chloroflexota bacterium]